VVARFPLTDDRTAREYVGRPEMIDCTDQLPSDCSYQRSDKHWRRDDLQGDWVDAKGARAGRHQYAGECRCWFLGHRNSST
jgi:hypothetical protein